MLKYIYRPKNKSVLNLSFILILTQVPTKRKYCGKYITHNYKQKNIIIIKK